MSFNESMVEVVALGCFERLGYAVRHGTPLAPRDPAAGVVALREGVQTG
jgi:hypothetical protein